VRSVADVFDGVPQGPGIDGDILLKDLRDWFGRFISTMTDADVDLLALWAAHTHLVVECYTTPRLQIDSPVPGSGKTTVLEHLQRLALRSVQMASLSSPALLTRMLDAEQRTILIDEVDRALDPKKDGVADLIAILNSGYKRGATRPVLVPVKGGGWDVKEMPTFAAVAMAGNNPNLPDATRSRIIRVLLLPDLGGTVEESDWETIEEDAFGLHSRIVDWADQVRDQVKATKPELPEGVNGRFREKWGPLKRVADAAGGDWSNRVDTMALHDVAQYAMDKEDGLIREVPAVVLLSHIFELWPEGSKFLPTSELIDMLAISHPMIWGEEGPLGKKLTAHHLGRMLATGYKINSDREGHGTPRGYFRSAFNGAWHRMRVTPLTQSGSRGESGESGADSPDSPDAPHEPDSQGGVAEPVQPPSGPCPLCDRPLARPSQSCSMRQYHGDAAS
jgi:hypothetical protein